MLTQNQTTDEVINALKEIGFSQKETNIYLSCLQLGKSSVIQIAKKAGIKRPTAYNIIESLLEKGVLSKFQDKKGQKFSAENPAKLLEVLEQKKSKLVKVMPNLLAITKLESDIKPEVRFYQGKEGLKAVYEDTLASCQNDEEILSYLSAEDVYSFLPDFINDYLKRRVAKGVRARGIIRNSPVVKKRTANDIKKLRKTKIVNEKEFALNIEKNIYKDKVAFMNFRGFPFGVIIKSPQIAKAEKVIFELLWKKLS